MTEKPAHDAAGGSGDAAARELSPAARRALAEAAARRAQMNEAGQPVELNGRGGPDPARYGDWEVKGIASDF
jgi:hypothetical protein